ncbi:MAG: phosphoglucosamine mutase [candidate division WOR-3 bacterium]|nr:MAG: phosphoglucosamine mutase [candidate division WOR-3 bacterium]
MALKFSISGLRGVVDRDLNPEVIYKYARSFGEFIRSGHVIIGRDTRESGNPYRKAVIKGLRAAGCRVTDLGIVPTPTVLLTVRRMKAKGGIVITASHNPIQWNALKFVSSQGLFLNERQFQRFASRITESGKAVHHRGQKVEILKSALKEHIQRIVSKVKPLQNSFRVAVDAVNGAGSVGLPRVLEEMGCKVFRLNCRFSPGFPRRPEPTRENISALCRFVKKCKLDIGFACDPDCDRLAVVDEKGRVIGEENSLVLAADYVLGRKKGSVVTNLSTTALMDFVARKHRVRLYRTKVGEANVVSKMKSASAVIGGEGNGGIIYPGINFTRDAMVGAALIVKLLEKSGGSISEIVAGYPQYFLIKKKLILSKERFEQNKQEIVDAFRGKLDYTDGLKIISDDYWLHIRPSQTEHVVRVIGESRDRVQVENYVARVKNILYRT